MNIYLGVTSANVSSIVKGQGSFWCVFKNSNIQAGDLLLLYKTKVGIIQIYEVISNPAKTAEFDCKMRHMITITTTLNAVLEKPITIKMLKENEVLMKSGAIRKNLQNTFFGFEEDEGKELLALIEKNNPGIDYK